MIIMRTLIIIFCFSFIGCNSKQALYQDIKSKGVLIAGSTDQYELKNSIQILNNDESEFATIYRNNEGEIIKSITDSLKIRAFYPDYSIVIFDSKKSEEGYEIFVNGDWKKIKPNNNLSFVLWENFIEQIYLGLKLENPLRVKKSDTSKIIRGYEDLYYEVLERDGDWIKVRCWKDCEGCPKGKIIEGWIKWKNDQKLLVNLYYIC